MIIVKIWEGLGNQLFQYAFARALSHSGKQTYIDGHEESSFNWYRNSNHRKYELDKFNIKLKSADEELLQKYKFLGRSTNIDKMVATLAEHKIWKWKTVEEIKAWHYNESYFELSGNYYIKGWFQNPKYFLDIRELLLKEITPKRKIKISKQFKNILESKETVSIHIRRGDYRYIQNCLPCSYYKSAVDYISCKISNPEFLFFSDDLKWVRGNFRWLENKYKCYYVDELGKYEGYEELMIMSCCKNNIIANSTFSWWAAWLNKNESKIVIAPKSWGPHRNDGADISKNILPEEWIKL